MYASIQDAYSKLLHIKDGRCLDFLACHDVGYQHANFQKYRTCGKKLRDICLSLLFSGTPGIYHVNKKDTFFVFATKYNFTIRCN